MVRDDVDKETVTYVAARKFRMLDIDYLPGDPVDVSNLPIHKISQFLNRRLIRPSA